ncbi:MAG: DNA glycosylase [Clostridia bacterium]
MKYRIVDNGIEILEKNDFCPKHIFECGQIFSWEEQDSIFKVTSGNCFAKIYACNSGYFIETKFCEYFENFFDLKTDYSKIKKQLKEFDFLNNAINFGAGIRILKQDKLETIISFIISANNNIKRIKSTLAKLRHDYGEDNGEYFSFPTLDVLKEINEQYFKKIGAGYRAPYLCKTIKMLYDNSGLLHDELSSSKTLLTKLVALSGVGPKVADCVALFAYDKKDVFPVDTWIEKVFHDLFPFAKNRVQMRELLLEKFGDLSGFAQQYLFYFKRETGENII